MIYLQGFKFYCWVFGLCEILYFVICILRQVNNFGDFGTFWGFVCTDIYLFFGDFNGKIGLVRRMKYREVMNGNLFS